jgi:hypothetical protein
MEGRVGDADDLYRRRSDRQRFRQLTGYIALEPDPNTASPQRAHFGRSPRPLEILEAVGLLYLWWWSEMRRYH